MEQTMLRPQIPDLSEYSGKVDFKKMKSMGAAAVGIRVSWLREDKLFKVLWQGAKDEGLLRLPYQYIDFRGKIKDQLDLFSNLIAKDPGELPAAADYEMDPSPFNMKVVPGEELEDKMPITRQVIGKPFMPANFLSNQKYMLTREESYSILYYFLDGINKNFHRKGALYTGFFFWQQWGSADLTWLDYKLWLPWYASEQIIRVPKPWTQWEMWQKTGNADGNAWGQEGKSLDLSDYHGTLDQLYAWANNTPIPPTPPAPPSGLGNYRVSTISWAFLTPNDGFGCKIVGITSKDEIVNVAEISGTGINTWARIDSPYPGWIRLSNLTKV
jgi:GH25 family lysozyme M1 (1,4-beta-N-acetylmuramidase)